MVLLVNNGVVIEVAATMELAMVGCWPGCLGYGVDPAGQSEAPWLNAFSCGFLEPAMWIFPDDSRAPARVGFVHRNGWTVDMDSVRISSDLPLISRKIAIMGSVVSRVITFCLLYFAPALAYEQGAPSPVEPVLAVAVEAPDATEYLDPKHGKDHDEDRGGERGHR